MIEEIVFLQQKVLVVCRGTSAYKSWLKGTRSPRKKLKRG
jgi:hypothetical protein